MATSSSPASRWPVLLVPVLLILVGMEGPSPQPTPVRSQPEPVLLAVPAYQRIELPANETGATSVEVTSPVASRLLAADVDCRCISVVTPLPLDLPANTPVKIAVRVVGVLPGVKQITLRTTTGSAKIALQVVTPGNGDGAAGLREIAAHAQGRLTVIVHDLKGQIRNCGCSTGSLGGIDRLAALPAEWTKLTPGVPATFYLSGNIDCHHQGVGAALAEHGWRIATPTEVIAGDPAALASLSKPDGPFVILTADEVGPQHARVLRPPLFEGLVAIAVIAGQSPVIIPIDRSLLAVPGLIERFPAARTIAVNTTASPSTSCATCHPAAFAAWQGSAHARAWGSLKPVDQVDSCVVCHSMPTPVEKVRVAQVHCQACHIGADAHAAAPVVKTKGTADCRGCHDAQRHPGFQREVGWKVIAHGLR